MKGLAPEAIIAVVVVRNEAVRLPYFLEHYRKLGVGHFLFIDNGSEDGTVDYLLAQADVSLWSAKGVYRETRFGLDWATCLLAVHGHGRWCLTLDADELLIYPFHETRPLPALTQWLEAEGRESYPAMMLDLYPEGPLGATRYQAGQDPRATLGWFDAGNYQISHQPETDHLWIQGGVRGRVFFAEEPRRAPTLSKIPLVKWHRRFVYVNSTHSLLPPRLNRVYGESAEEAPSGLLLHTKFLDTVVEKSEEDLRRRQHFGEAEHYTGYYEQVLQKPVLWCEASTPLGGWRKFEALGLLSRGGWM